MPYYVVSRGRQIGIFPTWKECLQQINKYAGSQYKKFSTKAEASEYMAQNSGSGSSKTTTDRNSNPVQSPTSPPPAHLKSRFKFNMEGFVEVYTDGACTANGRVGSKAGCGVWWGDGHELNLGIPASRNTNNAAEIQACTEAIKLAKANGIRKLLIYTDSKFTIQCAENWMNNWIKNGWRKADGNKVVNKSELMDLNEAMDGNINIRFKHVPGHRGIKGNEEADKLAREGAKMYR